MKYLFWLMLGFAALKISGDNDFTSGLNSSYSGTQQTDSIIGPGLRAMHTLLYHPELRKVILLDGTWPAIQPEFSQLWSWNGNRWKQIEGVGPRARYVNSVVYDSHRKKIISYGGRVGKKEEILGDTWEWDINGWKLMSDTGAGPRDHLMMSYDTARHRTVLFGGGKYPRSIPWATDTWEWDGTNWKQVATEGPIGRVSAMTFDSKRKEVLLFGGVGEPVRPAVDQPFYKDTWTWDGKTWKKRSDEGPPARARHALCYDPQNEVVLLYGGATTREVAQLGDMWQWDGKNWKEIPLTGPTPGRRSLHAMVFDEARGKLLLYGGNCDGKVMEDLWEWDRNKWTKIY